MRAAKRLPVLFWSVAIACEAAGLIGWSLVFGRFRNLVILLGAASGGLMACGAMFVVLLVWPDWRYKNDPGLSGPGLLHTYSGFLLPFGLINALVVFLNLFLVR